jgi:lincosamide nucleotidyltransferase A/C/D/E
MKAGDVLELLAALKAVNIEIWIDGGWGVDALLGHETRTHNDLDIVVEDKDVARLRTILEARGYRDLPRPDTRPCNFVLADNAGHEIDFHVIVLDAKGDGIYGPPADNLMYPASALTATGIIAGQRVKCIGPAFQVQSHTGYPPRSFDIADVTALCEKFGLEIPAVYRGTPKV